MINEPNLITLDESELSLVLRGIRWIEMYGILSKSAHQIEGEMTLVFLISTNVIQANS